MSKEPKRNVYVGHRYVPKLMGEWDKTESYEGLSIVTNKGTSYTSKKRVPKGIDILNEEYWVVTGNYNAQIEEYRKDVHSVKSDMIDLEESVNKDLKENKEYINTELDKTNTMLTQTVSDVGGRGINIMYPPAPMNSAEPNGTDATQVIQDIIDTYGKAYIPDGFTFNIYGTVEIRGNKSIEFGNNATLVKPSDAPNNDPVVWMLGIHSSVTGKGMRNSLIRSEKPSPNGVVCIGYKGIEDTSPKSVVYNTFTDISVRGRIDGGETVGQPSYALYLCNKELEGLPSYFHTIQNVFLASANVGLMLDGYANANIINNVQLYQVGNEKNLDGAGIKLKERDGKKPLDNVITNVFHHKSNSADTLFLDGNINYNTIQNIISEQGGTNGRWIRDTGAVANVISGIDNVSGGSSVSTGFWTNNSVTRRNSFSSKKIEADVIESNFFSLSKVNVKTGGFQTDKLTENTSYVLLQVDVGSKTVRSGIVELEVNLNTTNSLPFWSTGKIKFEIVSTASNNLVIKKIYNHASKAIFINPVVDGKVISFGIKVPSNSTSSTGTYAQVKYQVFGELVENVTEIVDSSVTLSSTDVIGLHFPQTTLNGTTRPITSNRGEMFFDTSLGKPIWWNGTGWIDATGTTV